MRRRNIKSVAHWVIMSLVLLFPILMVGVSSFGNHETINVVEEQPVYYETNEVSVANDIVVDNIYYYSNGLSGITYLGYTQFEINKELYLNQYTTGYDADVDKVYIFFDSNGVQTVVTFNNRSDSYLNMNTRAMFFIPISLGNKNLYPIEFINAVHETDFKYVKEYLRVEYTQNYYMREDVNQWCNSFRNLPVNQWYGNLLSAIGLGITTSMMMNVIYTYPLYVLWVYILDLVVDIFLVIINFGHNALKRLGGDNE